MADNRDMRTQLRFGHCFFGEYAESLRTRGLVNPQPHPARYILRVLGILVGVYVGILAIT